MKHCPYCGAEIPDGAFSFCPVCGNPLEEEKRTPPKKKNSNRKKPGKYAKRKKPGQHEKNPSDRPRKPKPADDGYDGYYDDVLPDDDGKVSQSIDHQTVKRIIGLVAGVLIAICACVLLMYML